MIAHKAYPAKNYDCVLIVVSEDKQMVINCTPAQYLDGLDRYNGGELIQYAFPFLDDGEREFLLTGMNSQEWSELFDDQEEN